MKKLLALLAALLLLGLVACGGEETQEPSDLVTSQPEQTEDPSLTALRNRLTADGQLFAIAYLGQLEGQVSDLFGEYTEDFPFLTQIPDSQVVRTTGKEVYCLVPADAEAALTDQAWICDASNGYQGEAGDTLYDSDKGQPVILIGNESDVLPNLLVTITDRAGRTMDYHPARNLCDGGVELPVEADAAYDFTVYHQNTGMGADENAPFLGHWQATVPFDGYVVVCELTFNEEGNMEYLCGYKDSDVADFLTGTYYVIGDNGQYPPGSVLFEMTGLEGDPFWGVFTLSVSGDSLITNNVSGDALVYGIPDITFHLA